MKPETEEKELKYLNYKQMEQLLGIVREIPEEQLLIRLLANGLAPRDVVRIRPKSFKYDKGLLRFKGKDNIKREADIDVPTLAYAKKFVEDNKLERDDLLFGCTERKVHDIVQHNGELAQLGKNITPTLLRDTWVFLAVRNGKTAEYIHRQLGNTALHHTTEIIDYFREIDSKTQQKVAIYIPVHDKKKAVVEKTLKAIKNLDYANFTATLLVNNSSDEFVKWLTALGEKYGIKTVNLGVIDAKETITIEGKKYEAVIESGGIFSIARKARNSGLEMFRKTDAEFAVMCDADCPPKTFAIKTCLKYFRDKRWDSVGIVGGVVFIRDTQKTLPGGKIAYRPAIFFNPTTRDNAIECGAFFKNQWTQLEVMEVDGIGMAWTMISREVAETINFEFPEDLAKFLGEDYYFCHLAKQEGFRVMCVCEVMADHLETKEEIKKYEETLPKEDVKKDADKKKVPWVKTEIVNEISSEFYDETYFEEGVQTGKSGYGGYYNHPLFEAIAKQLHAYFKPKKALDVGCAKGFVVASLVALGVDAYGIDLSDYAVTHSPEEIRERLKCGSATELPFKDKEFDLVATFDMMEHLKEAQYRKVIKEMGRVSSKNIIFSITTMDSVKDPSHVSIMPIQKWIEIIEQEIGTEFYRHKNNFLDQSILWFTPQMCVIYSRKR